jgi:hypothetical protein
LRGQLTRLTQQHAGIGAGAFTFGEHDDLAAVELAGQIAPTRRQPVIDCGHN